LDWDQLEQGVGGIDVTLVVCRHEGAEAAMARVREDLRLLRSLSPLRADRNLERGLPSRGGIGDQSSVVPESG